MRTLFVLILVQVLPNLGFAQKSVSVLFLGNSYTHRNNMPKLVERFALSQDHSLVYETNAPAGYTLSRHSTDAETIELIKKRNWEFVVLQEQSQLPSFPDADVNQFVYPALLRINSLIKENSDCTLPAFYRTWGRKNGDAKNCAVWPPVCTYLGMDSLLGLRYKKMADTTNGIVVPVGEVWRKFRKLYPTVELYKADESHPTSAGSYLAACCFYTAFFREDPTKSNFTASLADSTAARIKRLTKWMLYNKFSDWNIGGKDPLAEFEIIENNEGLVRVVSRSKNTFQNNWYFGDSTRNLNDTAYHGDTSSFNFEESGRYRVFLQTVGCFSTDSITKWINVEKTPVSFARPINPDLRVSKNASLIVITASDNFDLLKIYDLNGREVYSRSLELNMPINKTVLPSVFIIELKSTSNSRSVRRLFVQ